MTAVPLTTESEFAVAPSAAAASVASLESFRDLPWLQPYPDRLLAEPAPPDAVNSAHQRARATLRTHLPPGEREDWTAPEASAAERERLERFMDPHMRGDAVHARPVRAVRPARDALMSACG